MRSFISNAIASFGLKKNSDDPSQAFLELSDDESCSDGNAEEGLECPICWESFNIVENVPYVLWCGHTLCKNCVLGIKWATLKLSNQQIQIPFFISCPWCHLLTLRLVYKGNLKFPCKNFFLLWMVESLNGDRVKSPSSIFRDHQSIWSPRSTSIIGSQASNASLRRASRAHRLGHSGSSSNNNSRINNFLNVERPHLSLQKSLDYFIHFTTKFPLVIVLLLIVILAIPASAAILALYLLITVLFAVPSFLVLYFAYPSLDWLVREITS
uniref:RING-type domain-containing protein n=2 Tax=Davidia involucrata TaxID=16924 RepID=A0A5B6Z4P4_DAVIN